MKNLLIESYENELESNKKWLTENKCLEETTLFSMVKLRIAFYEFGISIVIAVNDVMEKLNNASI